jgi:hypothetical protein
MEVFCSAQAEESKESPFVWLVPTPHRAKSGLAKEKRIRRKGKENRTLGHLLWCGVTDDKRALVISIVIFLLSFLCSTF